MGFLGFPELFWWMIAYGLFGMAVIIGIMAFLLGGLLKPFFEVKRSRGKKILVIIRNPVQDYFKAGEVLENHLVFKDREGSTRRIPMIHGVVSRRATIFWCEVDDEKSCFFKRDDGKAVGTYDAKKTDSLILRALYRPSLTDDTKILMGILVLCIIAVVVGLGVGYMVYSQGQRIDLLQASIAGAKIVSNAVANNTVI